MYFKFFLKIIMKFQFLTILICFSFIIGCNNSSKKETVTISNNQKKSNIPKPIIKNISKKKLKEFNLVDIQEINKSIRVELKYATTDNFMKIKLYDKLSKAYLQKDVAERLSKCQDYLTSIDSKLFLLIYDAVRPLSTQQKSLASSPV